MSNLYYLLLCSLLFISLPAIKAEVSTQCTSEGKALANLTDLEEPSGGCNVDVSVSDHCEFDFATISAEYAVDCQNSAGQFYEQNVTWNCIWGQYNASFHYLNQPSCLGTSCSLSEARELYVTSFAPTIEALYAANGLKCNFTVDDDVDPTSEEDLNQSPESAASLSFVAAVPLIAIAFSMVTGVFM